MLVPKSRKRAAQRAVQAVVLFVVLVASGVPRLASAQTAAPTEYQVKAAYLYNFARLVTWPEAKNEESGELLIVGVLGEDPFGPVLAQSLEGKTANGKKFVVRRVASVQDAGKCQILFVSASEESRVGEILRGLDGKSVLTVGEADQFARRGGIINFRLDENRVRFEVNLKAAARARLILSSQLLKLARIVG